MRLQRNPKLRSEGASVHRAGGSVPAASFQPAFHHLSIPRLSREVPGQFNLPSADSKNWARYALNWLELGYLQDTDKGCASELVELAIHRWVNSMCGSLQHLAFNLHAAFDSPFYSYLEDEEESSKHELRLWVGSENCNVYVMEEKLGKLHAQNPDLAETALAWLGMSGDRTLNVWSPSRARDIATYIWWYGSDDQASFLEERAAYTEADEEEDNQEEDILGPDEWSESFPTWVSAASAKMDTEALRLLSKTSTDSSEAEIAAIVADLAESENEGITCIEEWGFEPVYTGCLLRWNEDDPMLRLNDDFVQNANYSSDSYSEYYGGESLPYELEAFKTTIAKLERAMRLIALIDRLVDKIADIT